MFSGHVPFELHVTPRAIAAGFYDRLNALQGRNRTYYSGAALDSHNSTRIWTAIEDLLPSIVGLTHTRARSITGGRTQLTTTSPKLSRALTTTSGKRGSGVPPDADRVRRHLGRYRLDVPDLEAGDLAGRPAGVRGDVQPE